jgi:transposase-like protein
MTRIERQKLWETRITEFKTSGQSAAAWAKENNIKPNQLYYWLRKEKRKEDKESTITWLPIDFHDTRSSSSLLVRIGPAAIEVKPGFEPRHLLNIVNTLLMAQ